MYVGIDLGGINIAVGLVNENCEIVKKGSVPTGRTREFSAIMADAAKLTAKLMEETGTDLDEIKAIGLGSPGTPDVKKKTIVHASTFPKIHHSQAQTELQKYFSGVPVFVENDANAAAYGELLAGAARGMSHVVMMTLGTGVGGGVIIDKKIYSGFNYSASELGHMVIEMNGVPCECGRRGCLEMYASATALIQQTKDLLPEYPNSTIYTMVGGDLSKINGKTPFDAAQQGDAAGEEIIRRYIPYLGLGIVNVVNTLQPEAVIIGGGICNQGEYLLSRLREYLMQYVYTTEVPVTKIIKAELGNDAGIIGAAMLWKMEE